MLGFNCLINNTQLYKDLSDFVKKIMFQRVADGKSVSIEDVYREARNSHFLDVDINSVGEMYKDVRPQVEAKAGKGVLDSDNQINKITGRTINEAIRRIISNRRKTELLEVGQQKPSESVAKDIVKLFEGDFIDAKDTQNKTTMREMQEAVKKAATALVDKQGKETQNKSFEEILKEALRLDELGVKDLNGRMNSMDDLFNQVSEEIDKVVQKMELAKNGMPQFKKDEIDARIEQFKNYTEKIKQGAYTLALSRSEQQKVLRDILKEKYGKTVTSNGKQKTVLDWNKMFTGAQDFKSDVRQILSSKGFTTQQIDKITNALKVQFDALKSTSQWNNTLKAKAKRMLNDDVFLSRVAATVVMSKEDSKGNRYRIHNNETNRYEPDWARWQKDKGQNINDLKAEIKSTFENTPKQSAEDYIKNLKGKDGNYYVKNGTADWDKYATDKGITVPEAKQKIEDIVSVSASQYRQIVSELERRNNPAKHSSKSDLEKLSELAQRRGFDETFNAKVYNMLGLKEEDAEAGRQVEELSKKVKQVLDTGGKQSRIAMSKILDDMNSIMARTQGSRIGLLNFARGFEWWMGNRNAYRLINYLNFIENNLSGVNQMVQTAYQSFSKDVAKKEFEKLGAIITDVAKGGKHFDMTDVERLSYQAHDYRFDESKSLGHNIKAAMNIIPNLALGVMDSAAHAYTMRIMFYNSAVLTNLSKLSKERTNELIGKGYSETEAKSVVKSQQKELKQKAIDNVSNALYDPTAEQKALEQAEAVLKLVTPNPTPAEIKREADNLMFGNMVAKGVLNQSQLESLLNASDLAAKKAIGKEAAISQNFVTEGLKNVNRAARGRIKKDIQNGDLSIAAFRIIGNSIAMKGILPFLSGAANWGVIALKKTPLGLARAVQFNYPSFKEQVSMAADLDPKKLGEIMESYNSRRNDIYLSLQGMVWTGLILGALAGMKAAGDDEDENFLEWVNNQFKEASQDNRKRKMLTRWLPPLMQTYNILEGNVTGGGKFNNMSDNFGQLFGYGALESPITKAIKYTGNKHVAAGFGQATGGIFDFGAYYNAFNSYADLIGEEETDKVKSHSTWLGDAAGVPDNDFINGVISGMIGYNLHQDINHYTGFEPSK